MNSIPPDKIEEIVNQCLRSIPDRHVDGARRALHTAIETGKMAKLVQPAEPSFEYHAVFTVDRRAEGDFAIARVNVVCNSGRGQIKV